MTPRFVLAALFIGVPLLEIYLFIKVGSAIGAGLTIVLVVLTALAGMALVRREGVAVLRRARASVKRDELPAYELLEGAALALGGVLLLIPGFFTDAVGFLCLWPTSRTLLLRALAPRIRATGNARLHRAGSRGAKSDRVIEGEYKRKPDE